MRKRVPVVAVFASTVALCTAACRIVPLLLMLTGLRGRWLSVFTPAADFSPFAETVAVVLLSLSWWLLFQRTPRQKVALLSVGTAQCGVAGLILLAETPIRDTLIAYL